MHRRLVWIVSLALFGCSGEERKRSAEVLAPPESSTPAPGRTEKERPPTENACPVTGCPGGCGPPQACTLPNGCSGTHQLCDDGWTECTLTSTSKRDCAECGSPGKQACNLDGTFGECISTIGRQCSCGGFSGTRYCSNGSWGECFTTAACGTQWCGNIGQYRCRVDGSQYCKMPSGVVPPDACVTTCGTAGFVYCIGGDGLCRATEVCNNCDDNVNGSIDENLSRPCQNRCGDQGTQTCVAGGWQACSTPERQEICDGRDNNCDGVIDEGTTCRQDTSCQ